MEIRRQKIEGHDVRVTLETRTYHGRTLQVYCGYVDGIEKFSGLRPCGQDVYPCISPPVLEIVGGDWVFGYMVNSGRGSEWRGIGTGIKWQSQVEIANTSSFSDDDVLAEGGIRADTCPVCGWDRIWDKHGELLNPSGELDRCC